MLFIAGIIRLFWIPCLGRQFVVVLTTNREFWLWSLSRLPFIGFVLNYLCELRNLLLLTCQVLASFGYTEFKLHSFYHFDRWKFIDIVSILCQAPSALVTTLCNCDRLSVVCSLL